MSGKLSADGKPDYTVSLPTHKYKGNGPEMCICAHMCVSCTCQVKSSLFIEPEIIYSAVPHAAEQMLQKDKGKETSTVRECKCSIHKSNKRNQQTRPCVMSPIK